MNGMSYTKSRFSVPAGPEGSPDCQGNHMAPDVRGKCMRCGEYVGRTHGITQPPESVVAQTYEPWRPGE